MTDFMEALLQFTCPGDQRKKGIQFQLTCNVCRESHKTQVWLCFLLLSFLSTSSCSAHPPLSDLKICVENVKHSIEKSDAMLYAPSTNDIHESKETCTNMMLKCYMLELIMVLDEEGIVSNEADCIIAFSEEHLSPEYNVHCPPCEAYSLRNITIFLDRLNHLLEKEMTIQSDRP
ncbi:interleukin-15-like isoform X1 [Scomber scombrus]|uniref:Interleukin n=1 Tax=Scomber scombrus TaxID=13677 RepID=A0AAV1NI35_SCOSC